MLPGVPWKSFASRHISMFSTDAHSSKQDLIHQQSTAVMIPLECLSGTSAPFVPRSSPLERAFAAFVDRLEEHAKGDWDGWYEKRNEKKDLADSLSKHAKTYENNKSAREAEFNELRRARDIDINMLYQKYEQKYQEHAQRWKEAEFESDGVSRKLMKDIAQVESEIQVCKPYFYLSIILTACKGAVAYHITVNICFSIQRCRRL